MRQPYLLRVEALRTTMREAGADVAVLLRPETTAHLTGFRALLYSRPIVLVLSRARATLIVPELEERHALERAAVDDVVAYVERPGDGQSSDRTMLRDVLAEHGGAARAAIEGDSCPSSLAEALRGGGAELVDVGPALVELRIRKDATELAVLERAATGVVAGVTAALSACVPGATEIEIDDAGTRAVQELFSAASGSEALTLQNLVMSPSGPQRSLLPHVFSTMRRLQDGDCVIHTRQVVVDGYAVELERTVVIGTPSAEQERMFGVMCAAQAAAVAQVRAGARCSDVDRAARDVIEAAGLGAFAPHRTGHGIGLAPHEPPYLRFDNDDPLRAGMVITIEPGIYVPGVGGFRHSDTYLVEEDGARLLTEMPRSLGELAAMATGLAPAAPVG